MADIVAGTFGDGTGEEYTNREKGKYLPMWVDVNQLHMLDVRPTEVAFKIQLLAHRKIVEVGGLTKEQLREKLTHSSIQLNEYGEKLLSSDHFILSKTKLVLQLIELTVADLGFPDGAALSKIYQRANELGLKLCPLEAVPYLRLQYLDQLEGEDSPKNQAPAGSLTIATKPISEDDDFPKGFYLRNIQGQLWLRGYVADDLHVWNPEDFLSFVWKM